MTLAELRAALERLDGLTGLERAQEARALSRAAAEVVAAAGDEGVWQATRDASYEHVAKALRVSESNVNRAVTRHRRRTAA